MNSEILDIPTRHMRRSQLYRWHIAHRANFLEQINSRAVSHYQAIESEIKQAKSLAIIDLSTFDRVGFKGIGTTSWVTAQKVIVPEQPNFSIEQQSGELVARLSWSEYLVLPRIDHESELINKLKHNWSLDTAKQTYLLPRSDSHSWFALVGDFSQNVLSKLCGVNLSATNFGINQIVQTSVARTDAILIRQEMNNIPCFYILSDVSSTEFLWESLLDAMQEFDGKAVGITTLRKFIDRETSKKAI